MKFGTDPVEDAFTARMFQAAYRSWVCVFSALLFALAGLAVGDPRSGHVVNFPIVGFSFISLLILMRTCLHTLRDQQFARLLCGRGLVVLAIILQVSIYRFANVGSVATFLCVRAMATLNMTFFGYSALHLHHRLVVATVVIVAAIFLHQPLSAIGRPLEPVITCTAVVLGVTFGCTAEHFVRNMLLRQDKGIASGCGKEDTMLHACEKGTQDELLFCTHQFQSALLPSLAIFGSATLFLSGLSVANPGSGWLQGALALAVALLVLRTCLLALHEPNRERLIFGRVLVALVFVSLLRICTISDVRTSAFHFLVGCSVIMPAMIFGGYSALDLSQRVACALLIVAGAALHPLRSPFNHSFELILITCPVLLGFTCGLTVERSLRRSFEARRIQALLCAEAQAQANMASERQRTVEAESVAFKLATAAANLTADSVSGTVISAVVFGSRL